MCLCRTKVPALLDRLRLGYEEVQVEATPRRVAVMVSHLARQQRGAEDRLRGPPAKVIVCPLTTPFQPLCLFGCAVICQSWGRGTGGGKRQVEASQSKPEPFCFIECFPASVRVSHSCIAFPSKLASCLQKLGVIVHMVDIDSRSLV